MAMTPNPAEPGPLSRADCGRLDAQDPFAHYRDTFALRDELIYLDGNSLGPLPKSTAPRLQQVITQEWGNDLIGSWNSAGWLDLPIVVGEKIARLIGAGKGQVVAADSTSINLFKALSGALAMRPDRKVIVSEASNFPTDLYMAQGLIKQLGAGHELRLVQRDQLDAAIDDSVAAVMLTQVDYRTGHCLPMAQTTASVHDAGAIMIWDLAHSAGAIAVDLDQAQADFAVGCTYKYLNGGPGATAFIYVARHVQDSFAQPLSGWIGHAAPFAFETAYRPAEGVKRALCGSPTILSLTAAECGVDSVLAAQANGGMPALHAKANRLIDIFVTTVDQASDAHRLQCITPREPTERGSQASFTLADNDQAYAVIQALIAENVIGDFRAPNVLRFGFAPLYLRHVDAFDAASRLVDILDSGRWNQTQFLDRKAVT